MKRLIFVLCSFFLFFAVAPPVSAAGKRLTVALASRSGAVVAREIERIEWRPGAEQISYIQPARENTSEGLYIYSVAEHQKRLLLSAQDQGATVDLLSYQWSPDGQQLLLEGGTDLWLYDVPSGRLRRLSDQTARAEDATFSPAGGQVAFVKDNDLYVLSLATDSVQRLTRDGSATILNGKLDWVYKEELAFRSTGRAYEWSPDGTRIAYLRLDDGPVPVYPITHYLSTHVTLSEERFPQAGDPNPVPSFHAVQVTGAQPRAWTFPLPAGTEYIGPSFSWTRDSQAVALITLNRHQDHLEVHAWRPAAGSDRVIVRESDPYWINSLLPPYFLKDGRFLWLCERDGWLHIYLYNGQGKQVRKLALGDWMIDHPAFSDVPMFQVDEKGGWVYFSSTNPDPRQRQIDRVRPDGTGFEQISKGAGTHTLNLSPDGRFLVDTFSDITTPPEARLLTSRGAFVAALDKPQNHLSEYALGKTEFVDVKARDGVTLYARLLKPADFDPSKKYPVIVYVYGGPHAQMVTDRWGTTSLLDQLFAQHGFLVWTLDNRGSWGRGHAWESVVFEHMGEHELQDQLAGIDYLKSLPYVDARRIGIRGWSYGGYMTLYALTHAPEVFKCGAAGGPVTDWKFYDTIYTERYMRTPEENPQGYRESSPLAAAYRLRAKVLLIHGADDDNVHMQNTMNFVQALVQAGLPFELYIQPGQKHGFVGDTVTTYLNQRLLDFFEDNLLVFSQNQERPR
jgi:dipeptidyl-peptidase 4